MKSREGNFKAIAAIAMYFAVLTSFFTGAAYGLCIDFYSDDVSLSISMNLLNALIYSLLGILYGVIPAFILGLALAALILFTFKRWPRHSGLIVPMAATASLPIGILAGQGNIVPLLLAGATLGGALSILPLLLQFSRSVNSEALHA